MEDEILFYLLEQPHSISDMIEDLTTKDLSNDAKRRSQQIPRIAGNWFRKENGHISSLKQRDLIKDQGRQYVVNKFTLTDKFFTFMGVPTSFPEHTVKGGDAVVADQYKNIMETYTYRNLKRRFRDQILTGETMKTVFRFQMWKESLMIEGKVRANSIVKRHCIFDVFSILYIALLFTVLKSRYTKLTRQMGDHEAYYETRRRRKSLEEVTNELARRVTVQAFPGARWEGDGFKEKTPDGIYKGISDASNSLNEEQMELLGDIFLLCINDSTHLFEQHARYGDRHHLFFNLIERGLLLDPETLDKDPQTGTRILPLQDVRSYLDDYARIPETTDAADALG